MKQFSKVLGWSIFAVGGALLLGCHKEHPSGTPPVHARSGSVCDQHILGVREVAGILSAPIAEIISLPGDAESCEFSTAGFPGIVISVRPEIGRTTVDTWMTGQMALASTALSGVGDAAVWQDALHELVAQKKGLLCDIQVRGSGTDLVDPRALPAAVGALCNKIFDAYER